MRISDWSSDVCSSDLTFDHFAKPARVAIGQGAQFSEVLVDDVIGERRQTLGLATVIEHLEIAEAHVRRRDATDHGGALDGFAAYRIVAGDQAQRTRARNAQVMHGFAGRSEEHTSELQSLMRSSYAVFCLKKKNNK